ncbi:DUF465 domain-containing protein [Pacificimonas flava]|uniref:DUF465 domain-containing protein n=2 Tax=Pacificimonas TaxID=1960290 RepID=A0A219B4D9_9SPHN|nr:MULTISPECIES: DUF465 domain-containing protein [Pacificimonas]MBZ6379556.1 DUF465 domain-containing protein [Pacificimonas aurantium]OWV33260.1 DUF465 domain-containing protein [Pacificimonas flava]
MGQAYTEALNKKHARLESEIAAEELRPHPDDALIHKLKREKLKLKDALNAA